MFPLLIACSDPAADIKTSPDDTAYDTDTTDALVVGPTDATMSVPFSIDADVTGTDRVGDFDLLDSAGTLDLHGVAHLGVAWQDHDWVDAGYHLYDVLSVAEDGSNLSVSYLYCDGDTAPYIYTTSFQDLMNWEVSSGTCAGGGPSDVHADLPALNALPEPRDPGVRIEGDDVAWDGTTGFVTIEGVERALYPFSKIDCTECPGGPWLEVHSMLVADDACFAILYLFPEDPTYVQVEYTLCLPTLERPTARLDAEWSGSLAGPPAPMLRPPPPLRLREEEVDSSSPRARRTGRTSLVRPQP